MGKKKIWVVFDNITKIKSQPITEEQLQLAILRMTEKDWDRFYLWSVGWESWQPLRTFLKSGQAKFLRILKDSSEDIGDITIKKVIAENIAPETKKSEEKTITKSMTKVRTDGEFTKTKTEAHTELDFSRIDSKKDYKKRSIRHELKIEVLLINKKGKTFRSFSKNISLSGTLLAENIPVDFYEAPFDVVIVNKYAQDHKYSRVILQGETVGNELTQRIQFILTSDNVKGNLTTLLSQYLEHQNNVKKKTA